MDIIRKGGSNIDGQAGDERGFTREEYYILEGVPLPLFLASKWYIPKKGTFHPQYPFYVAEDSKVTNNMELTRFDENGKRIGGRGITVSTYWRLLNMSDPTNNNDDLDKWAQGCYPWLLPVQDYKTGTVRLEESLDYLWRYGIFNPVTDIEDEEYLADPVKDKDVERWRKRKFENAAGTKLTGTKQRSITSASFYYFAYSTSFKEEYQGDYSGAVNDADIRIAGRDFKKGQDDRRPERRTALLGAHGRPAVALLEGRHDAPPRSKDLGKVL